MRHRIVVGVHLVIRDRRGRVLLGLRPATSAFGAGQWHVPAGHLEEESAQQCATREAREELGIAVNPDALRLLHALHQRDPDDGHARIQLFFGVEGYAGRAENCEPDRCTELGWWPQDALPPNTVPYTAGALAAIAAGVVYAESGWTT
ncbi:NUDIX domain-containing protein [Yinghuangia sp. YIM S09857]|uniref:NUDIX domain-containing protein n=1 Tax=Yinghuangia sp. YIM S09857 TaxID=3436929 RepID=UPI003F533B8F